MILAKITYTYKNENKTYTRKFNNEIHLNKYIKSRSKKQQNIKVQMFKKQ